MKLATPTFLPTVLIALATMASMSPAQTAPQQNTASPDSSSVTEIDAGLGPCTADFTVNDSRGSPIYNAKIRLHIAYGKFNFHKLDLEAGTNSAGKARFIGLPNQSKEGLFFRASAGAHETSVFDNPAQTCKKDFSLVVERKLP